MEEEELDGVELKTVMELVMDSLGPADEVIDYLKKEANKENMTYKDYITCLTAKELLSK